MQAHHLAGKQAPKNLLIDVSKLEAAYYANQPDLSIPHQQVIFGTSGHRGTPFENTFNEAHILAITQAICDYRRSAKISGPLFMGKDSHAISGPAERTALEVLAANNIETFIQLGDGFTPTPAISRSILSYNFRSKNQSDGIVITPSHNPPTDGGFKYNPPNGGPADTDVTDWIEKRANHLLQNNNSDVKRVRHQIALRRPTTHQMDFQANYISELATVIDMNLIRESGVRIGADPLGGASVHYWEAIQKTYRINLQVVNSSIDPTFSFMPLDHDGKIRMDCSSPYAMAGLVRMKDSFDIAFGNDTDADRHGIVSPSVGLMNPNHFLAVAIDYVIRTRNDWPRDSLIGKTLVSSSIIDRVVRDHERHLFEVPVGFKWFASGLLNGSCCFGAEESAGASFLRHDASVWTTDKDGIILSLLAAEIVAKTGNDPGQIFAGLAARFGTPFYQRIDVPATPNEKRKLKDLRADLVNGDTLAGEPIIAKLTHAPGNNAPIGGLKVVAKHGWFAVRPSGTENILKLYAESFNGESHLNQIMKEAKGIIESCLHSQK